MKKILICVILSILIVSCATKNTDITKTNKDGSPIWTSEIPQSSKFYYGVGSSKLTSQEMSQKAADSIARADIAKQVASTIKDATAIYSNTELSAFETVTVDTTNTTLNNIQITQRWTDSDGRVWSLASLKK